MRPDNRPVVCLVTDRLRLAARVGVAASGACDLLLRQVSGAVEGGVDVVQIRERDLDARPLVDVVTRCCRIAAGSTTRIVVNDRLDVAIAAGADGVHLREDGIPAARARVLAAGLVRGRSIHRPLLAAETGDVTYLLAGAVFGSSSKPDAADLLGLDGLCRIVKSAGKCPVWAIGGITHERLGAIIATGARGAAAIGAFQPACALADLERTVAETAQRWRFSFDSADFASLR